MVKRQHLMVLLMLVAMLMVACGGTSNTPTDLPSDDGAEGGDDEAMAEGRTLVFADISDDPVQSLDRYSPLIEYLADNLSEYGISGGEVRVVPDVETLAQLIEAGEVDLFFDSVYPALLIGQETGAAPILRRWRGGAGEYHTVIFVRSDSGIETLEDLQGKIVAYDEPASTSGFFLPTILILQAGLTPVQVDSPEAAVDADKIGYVFSEDDDNTIQWVVSELVDAGALDNLNYADEIPEETRADLTVIAESIDVPRQVVMAGPHLDADLIEAIKAVLIDLEKASGGLEILDTARTTRFDDFPQGPDAALAEMRELLGLVSDQ